MYSWQSVHLCYNTGLLTPLRPQVANLDDSGGKFLSVSISLTWTLYGLFPESLIVIYWNFAPSPDQGRETNCSHLLQPGVLIWSSINQRPLDCVGYIISFLDTESQWIYLLMSIGVGDKGEFEWVMSSYVLQLLLLHLKKDRYMHTWTWLSLYLQMFWHITISSHQQELWWFTTNYDCPFSVSIVMTKTHRYVSRGERWWLRQIGYHVGSFSWH